MKATMMHAWLGAALTHCGHGGAGPDDLRIFTGGQQRPDVMRKIADVYKKRNPDVKVEVEVGGATSERSSNT